LSCVSQAETKIEHCAEHAPYSKISLSVIVDTYADALFECGQVAADSTVAMTIGSSTAARGLVRSGSTMTIASSTDEAKDASNDDAENDDDDDDDDNGQQPKKKPRLDSDAVVLPSNESQALDSQAPDSQLW
jgi:hypothetical protein